MNKIIWFYLPCCFLIIKSIAASDVTLVLQKLQGDDTRYNMTWVLTGENLNSGIALIQPDRKKNQIYESQYVPDFPKECSCKINSNETCNQYWTRNDWQIKTSFNINLDVVTDKRWEDFKEIYTNGSITFRHVHKFPSNSKNKLTINFSIRVEKEAHIFLCNNKHPHSSNCYWILLAAFNGISIAIRKCEKQIPNNLEKIPENPCASKQQELMTTPREFLSFDEWKHFSISINKNNIVMKSVSNNVTLLNWSDEEENYINIQHLIVRSFRVPAYWKFNTYEFTYSTNSSGEGPAQPVGERIIMMDNKLCVSFYVAMCAQCSLIISGSNLNISNDTIFKETVQPLKEFAWQEVKLKKTFPTNVLDIQLFEERHCLNNCHEQFWAMDDFRLCTDNEVRVLNVEGNALNSSFQILASPSKNINLKPFVSLSRDVNQDPTCPINAIGSTTCTNCSQIFGHNNTYCLASIICDYSIIKEGTCRCSPGYTGETCQDRCSKSYYGNGCKEKCGFCSLVYCHHVTGICTASKECKSNFTGLQCNIPPFPVLKNSPILINSSYTQITIQIPNFLYRGLDKPAKYKVTYELTNDNNTRYETDSFLIFNKSPQITLKNLSSDTSYTIRVVLLTSENQFYNETFSVPMIVAKTTCSDVQERNVNVTSASNSSVVVTFQDNPELCPIKNYEIKFLTNDLFGTTDNKFYIPNLVPDTDYNITIVNKNKPNRILNYYFRTKEEAPSAIQSLEVISSSATSLTISWKQPLHLNGKLRHYIIKLKHFRYLACEENDNIQNKTLEHPSTNITLKNLIPYSQYDIEIAGVTVEVGEFSSTVGETKETNTPDELETPTHVNVQSFSTTALITLQQATCSSIKGKIIYYISARCSNEWCNNMTMASINITYYFAKKKLNITNLLPYSNYSMDIKVGRINGNLYNGELLPSQFNTLPAAPHEAHFVVYEESKNILRLRITPPYPPTGELEQYFVQYCPVNYCHNRNVNSNCIKKYFEAVSCKIWTNYHCLDISEDLHGEKWYRIYVQARNKNISHLSYAESDCEKTAQRTSHAPEELTAFWDNFYNLTLQWNHPSTTNGPLTKFYVTILKNEKECNRSDYMVREETTKLTYNYVVSINDQDCYTSKLTIKVQSFNEKAGETASFETYSPPEAPTLNTSVESVSSTTITIRLSAKKLQPPGLFLKSYMYIVLSESMSKFEIGNVEDTVYKLENLGKLSHAWLIAQYNLTKEISMEKNLTIGSNNSSNLFQSDFSSTAVNLTPDTLYRITIMMYNEYQGIKRYRIHEIVKSTSSGNSSSKAFYSIILVVVLLLFWIYYRKRKSGRWCSIVGNRHHNIFLPKDPNVIPLTQTLEISPIQIIDSDAQIPPNQTTNKKNKINGDINNDKFSKVINLDNFDIYVKEAIMNGELERQHLSSSGVETKPLDYGYVTPNNYTDVIQTESEYEEVDYEEYSDKIDANYIEGYVSKCAYIATKIPQIAAINNFWKLIWEDNVKYIVLLSSVTEEEMKNHIQYWPKIKETTQFEDILVKCISIEIFADYEHRIFLVSSNEVEREVQQLHFTSWAYHGVLMYPQGLVPLLKILFQIPESNSPIVLHCCGSMQAIGTVILCDLCLKMASHKGVLDVIKYQRIIRAQKANLIGNFEQYKFVHLVLLECLKTPDTSIICDNEAKNNILSLLETSTLENQFRFISEVAWQDQAMRPLLQVKEEPSWQEKNRVQNIKASGHGRVYLSPYPKTDRDSTYINAVEVDGFKAPKRFIVTQQPLPNTIADFWRMIDEKEVSTIISLNTINKENDRSCVFWPTFSIKEIRPLPYLVIKFINKISKEEIAIINLELHNYKNKVHNKRDIYFMKLKNWPANQLIPNSNESLLKLWYEVKNLSQTKYPIVVTCYDGSTACGLFTAFTFVIEKIKLEQQCDVCLAVRTVRRNREQFVKKLEQFKYLYNITIAHLDGFGLYANTSTYIEEIM